MLLKNALSFSCEALEAVEAAVAVKNGSVGRLVKEDPLVSEAVEFHADD
jgi:hypothetical protein